MNPMTVEEALKHVEVWEHDDCLQIGAKVARVLAKELELSRKALEEFVYSTSPPSYFSEDMCKDCE